MDSETDFEELANQHKDAVYRQMLRVCGNQEDAEDVLVEALLRAYKNLDQLRESAAFRGWLAQIGRRVCWRLRSREKLMPIIQLSQLEEDGKQLRGRMQSAEAEFATKEMADLLHSAVDTLPEKYQTVYRMRDIEERSGEEVAEELGLSLAAMKSRLHRARAMVRERLDEAMQAAA